MLKFKNLLHTTAFLKARESISWQYKTFKMGYLDKVHQSKAGDDLIQAYLDANEKELQNKDVGEIVARGSPHPPRPGEPEGAKDRLTAWLLNSKGERVEALHLNTDGTVDAWAVGPKKAAEEKAAEPKKEIAEGEKPQ